MIFFVCEIQMEKQIVRQMLSTFTTSGQLEYISEAVLKLHCMLSTQMKWTVCASTSEVYFSILSFIFNQFGRLAVLMVGKLQKNFPLDQMTIYYLTVYLFSLTISPTTEWHLGSSSGDGSSKANRQIYISIGKLCSFNVFSLLFLFEWQTFLLYFASRPKKIEKSWMLYFSSVDCPFSGCTVAFCFFFWVPSAASDGFAL